MIENTSILSRIRVTIIYFIVIVLGIMCLFPLLYVVAVSFSSAYAVAANKVFIWPVDFTLVAYEEMLEDTQFFVSFRISVVRVFLSLVLHVPVTVLMAYPLSHGEQEFPAQKIYMRILLFAMMFGGGMIPTYLLIRNLGLLNTIWALVLPGVVAPFNVILVMNFIRGLPKSLEEAAIIDGANPVQVLLLVMCPCLKPVISSIALFNVVGSWNDYFSGMVYNTKIANYPLMSYVQSFSVNVKQLMEKGTLGSELELSSDALNSAKIVVSVVPLLMVYPFFQKYLISGIVMGSVKE